LGWNFPVMKETDNPDQQIDELIIKLRNLQILLEEAVLRGAHSKARELIGRISETTDQIEHIRKVNNDDVTAQSA
jgi:hypothetical protein